MDRSWQFAFGSPFAAQTAMAAETFAAVFPDAHAHEGDHDANIHAPPHLSLGKITNVEIVRGERVKDVRGGVYDREALLSSRFGWEGHYESPPGPIMEWAGLQKFRAIFSFSGFAGEWKDEIVVEVNGSYDRTFHDGSEVFSAGASDAEKKAQQKSQPPAEDKYAVITGPELEEPDYEFSHPPWSLYPDLTTDDVYGLNVPQTGGLTLINVRLTQSGEKTELDPISTGVMFENEDGDEEEYKRDVSETLGLTRTEFALRVMPRSLVYLPDMRVWWLPFSAVVQDKKYDVLSPAGIPDAGFTDEEIATIEEKTDEFEASWASGREEESAVHRYGIEHLLASEEGKSVTPDQLEDVPFFFSLAPSDWVEDFLPWQTS